MPSPQVSASGLSSVVSFPSMDQWEAIDNDESLTLFHAKFWGKGMAIEEEEWSSTQPPVADIGSELEGKELHGDTTGFRIRIVLRCQLSEHGSMGGPY